MSQKDTDKEARTQGFAPQVPAVRTGVISKGFFLCAQGLIFFCRGSICHWEAVEREEKLDPAGRTGHLEAHHLRTVL